MDDLIYRQDAVIAVRSHRIDINDPKNIGKKSYEDVIRELPSAQPKIIRCKDCKHWNNGNEHWTTGKCNCSDIRVDCHDYYVGDLVTEEDFYCGFAKRREDGEVTT